MTMVLALGVFLVVVLGFVAVVAFVSSMMRRNKGAAGKNPAQPQTPAWGSVPPMPASRVSFASVFVPSVCAWVVCALFSWIIWLIARH